MDYSKTTLGELISHTNGIIRRNAMSILKQLQRIETLKKTCTHYYTTIENYGICKDCGEDMRNR